MPVLALEWDARPFYVGSAPKYKCLSSSSIALDWWCREDCQLKMHDDMSTAVSNVFPSRRWMIQVLLTWRGNPNGTPPSQNQSGALGDSRILNACRKWITAAQYHENSPFPGLESNLQRSAGPLLCAKQHVVESRVRQFNISESCRRQNSC